MPTLDERMVDNLHLRQMVLDLSIPNRQVAREFDLDESVVRRWRAKHLSDPHSVFTPKLPVQGQTQQWVAGVDLHDERGEARTLPTPVAEARDMSDDEILKSMDIDPEKWQITSRRESKWQSASGEWLSAHKVEVARRGALTGDLSVAQLTEILSDYARPTWNLSTGRHENEIFVVPIADLQAGKKDGGGTAALVDRFGRITQEVRERLINEGGATTLCIPVLGDCIEGIVSQGGKLVTRLDISITEQVRVYRRLLMHMIATLAPFAENVVVVVLPGNHDETYRVVDTPVTDSWAIEGASAVQDALELSGDFNHVRFIYPADEELVITLNVGTEERPFILGFTHGHLMKAPNSMASWWSGQTFGRQHGGSADIMFTGHFHHLRVENMGSGRTWIQAPALDGGSDWYRRNSGGDEPVGMLSLWVTPGRGIGWEGLVFHTGE